MHLPCPDAALLHGPVAIADATDGLGAEALESARTGAVGGIRSALATARDLSGRVPLPGNGRTGEYLSVLATVASADLTVARVVEPHLDALAILDQAGLRPGSGVYGGRAPRARSRSSAGRAVLDAAGGR